MSLCQNEWVQSSHYFYISRQTTLTSVDWSFSDITDSSSFHNVTDNKLLDSLILWYASCTVCTTNWLYVTTVVFTTSSVTAFLCLQCTKRKFNELSHIFPIFKQFPNNFLRIALMFTKSIGKHFSVYWGYVNWIAKVYWHTCDPKT